MRALIAIPAYPLLGRDRIAGFQDDVVAVPVKYVHALRRAGAVEAILLPCPAGQAEVTALLDRYDGLMLLGGGDLAPSTYGQEPGEHVYDIDDERDATELDLCRTAIDLGMPVLAICRGHQVLNVALGGTLDQHITHRGGTVGHGLPGADGRAQIHPVTVDGDSRLAAALGATDVNASSHHHQAVDAVGEGLRVVARAPDGVIEGIELDGDGAGWVVGVQWHPEDTAEDDAAQQSLFNTFVDEAVKHRG